MGQGKDEKMVPMTLPFSCYWGLQHDHTAFPSRIHGLCDIFLNLLLFQPQEALKGWGQHIKKKKSNVLGGE